VVRLCFLGQQGGKDEYLVVLMAKPGQRKAKQGQHVLSPAEFPATQLILGSSLGQTTVLHQTVPHYHQ
jgi:hypothetical protein